jgi:drug/metabolite transporter (DMT)-like permease
VALSILSGVLLGGFLVLLARVSPTAGLVPLLTARATALVTVLAVLVARREPLALPAGVRGVAIAAALVDGAANVLYLLIVRSHAVSIVGTIVSLGPGFAVVLGALVLRERFTKLQSVGLACAVAAIVLLTNGSSG